MFVSDLFDHKLKVKTIKRFMNILQFVEEV